MQVYTAILSNMHIQQYINPKSQAGKYRLLRNNVCLSTGTGEKLP